LTFRLRKKRNVEPQGSASFQACSEEQNASFAIKLYCSKEKPSKDANEIISKPVSWKASCQEFSHIRNSSDCISAMQLC